MINYLKNKFTRLTAFTLLFLLLLTNGCLPGAQENRGGRVITLYGFSIMKEVLEKEIYPAFAAKWKAENNAKI
jgi:hypothetical protein